MDELVRITRGVWRPADHTADLAGRVAATLAACPADSVVAGVTAARLHGLWLPTRMLDDAAPIELVVHRSTVRQSARPGSRRAEVRARRQRLEPGDVTDLAGIPVVAEARAWMDLAGRLREPDLVALGDSVLRGASSMDDLSAVIDRAKHCRGVVRARAVMPFLDGASRSHPESHLRFALVSRGLPKPRVNEAIFTDAGEWIAEPDLSYHEQLLALECNGANHADIGRMRRDITRETDVDMRGGWLQLTFGPAQVYRRPDEVALRVRRHLIERSRRRPSDPWLR